MKKREKDGKNFAILEVRKKISRFFLCEKMQKVRKSDFFIFGKISSGLNREIFSRFWMKKMYGQSCTAGLQILGRPPKSCGSPEKIGRACVTCHTPAHRAILPVWLVHLACEPWGC